MQSDIINRAGSTPAGVVQALEALTGSFLRVTGPPIAEPGWAFRHPTLWEGFAAWVPTQSHLLTVVLAGLTDSALLSKVDCEAENAEEKRGTLLRVPPTLYRPVAKRLAAIGQRFSGRWWSRVDRGISYEEYRASQRAFLAFLAYRSSDTFLQVYMDVDPDLPRRLVDFTSSVNVVPEPDVLSKLHRAGLLTEEFRLQAVERMRHLAVTTPDDGWIDDRAWKVLLTADDRPGSSNGCVRSSFHASNQARGGLMMNGIRTTTLWKVLCAVTAWPLKTPAISKTAHAFDAAVEWHSQLPAREREDTESWTDTSPLTGDRLAPPPSRGRSMFDDIDARSE